MLIFLHIRVSTPVFCDFKPWGSNIFPVFLLIQRLHIIAGYIGISAFILFSLSVHVMRLMRGIEYLHSQKMCIRNGS